MNAQTIELQHTEFVGSTLIYRGVEVTRALDALASAGFREIELCIVPGFCPHVDLTQDPLAEAGQMLPELERLGLRVASVNAVPGYFTDPDADRVADLVLRCIGLAAALNAEVLVLPSGAPVSSPEWEPAVQKVAKYLAWMADEALAQGVQICVEAPHWNTLAPTIDWAARFFDVVAPSVACAFDTSHVSRAELISLAEGFRRIGTERIRHIHLRDVVGEDITVTPGRGHADFAGLFHELRSTGYTGRLVLELELDGANERKQTELQFALAYLGPLLQNRPLPSSMRLRTSPVIKFAERFIADPKQELRRHSHLIRLIRAVRPMLLPLMPVKTYEGHWRNRWRIWNRGRTVRQRSHSVALVQMPEKPIRVVIIGCGYAGTMHAYAYDRLAGVRIVGVCDQRPERAASLARQVGCPAYTNLDELLDSARPDLVSICTREWLHYEHTLRALQAGADVFCEKIMATRYGHAEEMLDLARKQRRVLAINYNYRFVPGVRKLKEIIDSQAMGALQSLNIRVHAFSYHHALDLVSFLGGEILEVAAKYRLDSTARRFGGTQWDDYDPDIIYVPAQNLIAAFRLRNGATACITSSSCYDMWGFVLAIDAVMDEGAVTLSGINFFDVMGKMSWTAGRIRKGIRLDYRRGVFARGYEYCFYRSIESFVNAYVTGIRPETPGDIGLFNIELERAVYESGAAGHWLPISRQ